MSSRSLRRLAADSSAWRKWPRAACNAVRAASGGEVEPVRDDRRLHLAVGAIEQFGRLLAIGAPVSVRTIRLARSVSLKLVACMSTIRLP